MFSEHEVRSLEISLHAFEDENTKHQRSIGNVIEKYGQLLSNFKSLQSDYEETKEARERYKKLAKGQDKSPFILLLVDGDGYFFHDALVKRGAEGGAKVATTMQSIMEDRVRRLGLPDDTKIIVRIYMNLQGVSQAFHRYGCIGSNARAIAPFTAALSNAELYDVVDCGEKREFCETKVKENFSFFTDNPSCRHVFFAGCQSSTYLPLIKRYNGRKDHLTLIRASMHMSEYDDLGYDVEDLVGIFNKSKPDDQLFSRPPPSIPSADPLASPAEGDSLHFRNASWKASPSRGVGSVDEHKAFGRGDHSTAPQDESRDDRGTRPSAPVCTHWIRGACKYGQRCTKRHEVPPDPRGNGILDGFGPSGRAAVSSDWRTPTNAPYQAPAAPPAFSVHFGGDRSMWEDTLDGMVVADILPKPEDHLQEMIPVNGDGYRLDFYHGPWNRDDAADYQARIIMAKPCNSFQLTGHCKNGITCHYDHAPMEPRLLEILKQIVHDYPCKMRGACRDKDCHVGHICYNPGCKAGRRGPGCRLHWTMHQVDPHVVDWVPAQVAEPLDMKTIPNNEEDLLIESLDDDADGPEVLPSTKNFELTSAWAQSVLSPSPSQLPTTTATVLESAAERESTIAEETSSTWHETDSKHSEANIEKMRDHFRQASHEDKAREDRDSWNLAQEREAETAETQHAPQEQQSPNMLSSSRWNSVDESSQYQHPAAQAAAGWNGQARKDSSSYDRPAKHYPSPPTSNSPAPSRQSKDDQRSSSRFPPTPLSPGSHTGTKADAKAWVPPRDPTADSYDSKGWVPPRGPASDSYTGPFGKWGEHAASQNQGGWPAPVSEDDGPYGW